jgi:hypothetical protein
VIARYAKAISLRSLLSSTTRKVSRVGNQSDHCLRLNTSSDR